MQEPIWTATKNYYPELRKLAQDAGLYKKRPWRIIVHATITLSCFAATLFLAHTFRDSWLALIGFATLAGFLSLHMGYVMHDAGHRQCSRSTLFNNILGFISTSVIGMSFLTWMDIHNEHHDHPNHDDDDPDVSVPFIAYSEGQVHDEKRTPYQIIIRYQTWFYVPLLTLIPYSKRYFGFICLMQQKKTVNVAIDMAITVLWHFYYYGVLWLLLGFWPMLVFSFVHQAALGLFFGMVFAPNHKGMPIIEKDVELDFLTRQVVTSRNFGSNIFIDFMFGGLNYQIEHHLFPDMPRYNMRKAKKITEEYCKKYEIPYYETSLVGSYVEIYKCLRDVALHARNFKLPVADLRAQLNEAIEQLKIDMAAMTEDMKHRILTEEATVHKNKTWDRLMEIQKHMKENRDLRKQKVAEYMFEVKVLGSELKEKIQQEIMLATR